MLKTTLKPFLTTAVAAIILLFLAVKNKTFSSQKANAMQDDNYIQSNIKNGVFKARLIPGKQRQIGGRHYQCWVDEARGANTDLGLLTARYLPTDNLLEQIDAAQYVCGKSQFKNADELQSIKNKFKNVVRRESEAADLNLCEASTLHFLIRDVSRKSAFNTAPCSS